jgi:2-methylcitrate dehydratase PrpD
MSDDPAGDPAPDPERTLARFALELSLDDLPPATRDHVGLVVADTVGAAVGGCRLDEPRALAAAVDDPGPGRASVLGTDAVAPPGRAAMVVATAGTSLELDEGHQYAGGHPSIHALPAALAEAEAREAAPADWLAGFVAGYEVGTRVARACAPLDPSYHMHGLWGAVGATAAVARVRGLSLDRTTEALRMAPNHALHTRFETALEGATVRNTYAGASNLAGSLVATQAEAGFSGLERGIERHLGRVVDDADGTAGVSSATLTAGLGESWEIERGYFKTHAACRFTHPTLDAVAALAAETGLDPDAVESVTVETYRTAARLDEPRPTNPLQAKFSLPFAVATRLRRGHSRLEAFAPAALDEPTYALAERVTVREAPDLTERAPDRRGARVAVVADGERHERAVPQARGGADDPFSEADLEGKFEALVAPALGADRAADLWAASRDPSGTPAGRIGALATPP